MTFVLFRCLADAPFVLIKKWNKVLRPNLEHWLGLWVWAALLSHIWRRTAADISHKAAGAGPMVLLWTGCCWRVSGADRLPDVKRADWWWEDGWARWALQEISISRQRGIIVESNNKTTSSVVSETEKRLSMSWKCCFSGFAPEDDRVWDKECSAVLYWPFFFYLSESAYFRDNPGSV